MVRYVFHGIVAPLGNLQVKAEGGPTTFPVSEVAGALFSFRIDQDEVTVNCDVPRPDQILVNLMLMFSYYLVRGVMDGVLFLQGRGAVLIITRCTVPGEMTPRDLDLYEDELEKLISISHADFITLSLNERGILKHIHDLVDCIVNPLDSELNCGRAIEGFAQLLLPGGKPPMRWARLREALNLDKTYTQPISDASAGPRHGAIEPQSLPLIVEIRRRSWTIANRFLEFRKQGSINLSDPDFPILLAP
jgi:hypothetical protein